MLPVTVARAFADSVAIRYVLPVLRMTSCFYTTGHAMVSDYAACDIKRDWFDSGCFQMLHWGRHVLSLIALIV